MIVLFLLVFLYLVVCTILYLTQSRFIFASDAHLDSSPDDIGLFYESVRLSVGKGAEHGMVQGWWIPINENYQDFPVILLLHGNRSNLGDLLEMAQRFHALGWSSFSVDYRGYGQSDGPFPNERRIYEDAEVAWQYLVKERHLSPSQIIVYGHSLGGAIAIELATRHPEMAGVIVEGTFTSILDVAKGQGRFKLFPLQILLRQRFDSISKVKNLSTPILFLHGAEDQSIPCRMSYDLYEACASAKKTIAILPEAGHINLPLVGNETYLRSLRQFVKSHIDVEKNEISL